MSVRGSILLALVLAAASTSAHAAEPAPKNGAPEKKAPDKKAPEKKAPEKPAKKKAPDKKKARAHFERAMQKFERQDYAGARSELDKAYALHAHVAILYYLGIVHKKQKDWAQAVTAMERVIEEPGNLAPERLEEARDIVSAQFKHTGSVAVTANVDDATVYIDGVEAGTTSSKEPLRANTGMVFVTIAADGHVPVTKSVAIEPGKKAELDVKLEPGPGELGYIELRSGVPGAEVYLDDTYVATTPLESPLPVAAGVHRVELKREAYKPVRKTVTVPQGKTRPLEIAPKEDDNEIDIGSGKLKVRVAQDAEPTVIVDGLKRDASDKIPMAVGLHQVRVEAEGFLPLERSVTVKKHDTVSVRLDLAPNEATRTELIADAETMRQVSWGLGIGGLVVMGAGIGMLAWAVPAHEDAGAELDNIDNTCDALIQPEVCRALREEPEDDRKTAESVLGAGAAAVGLGFIAFGTGVLLYLALDGPDDFEVELPEEYGSLRLRPDAGFGPQGAFTGVTAAF